MKKIIIAIAGLHLVGWGLLLLLGGPSLVLGVGVLAYTLGFRHAFDADHLVAIDATTRKLVHEHKDSHGVGFFFSLGHSTVVFVATALSIAGISSVGADLLNEDSALKQTGGFIGSLVAGSFLMFLAVYNLYILKKIICREDSAPKGFWARFIRPANSAKQMYPVGLLFGLGFDTATSIAILSLSIVSVASGQLLFAAIALPIIFTSGMALGDTLSGYIMHRGIKWSVAKEQRRTYNLLLTLLAIIASIAIATLIFIIYPIHYDKHGIGFLVAIYVALFVSIYAAISNAMYISLVLKNNLKPAGASIAHFGFALMIVGMLLDQYVDYLCCVL
jgi:high-affinity nickel-transport protein